MKIFAIYIINAEGEQEVHLYATPRYMKRSYRTDNALKWQQATGYDDAEIVSIHGDLYNIAGKEAVEDDDILGEAVIVEGEAASFIESSLANSNTNSSSLITLQEEIENALCEIDETIIENQAMIEEALCELDAKMI